MDTYLARKPLKRIMRIRFLVNQLLKGVNNG